MNHILSRGLVLGAVSLASALAYSSPPSLHGPAGAHTKLPQLKTETKAALAKRNASVSQSRYGVFLENGGQWDSRALAHAQGPGLDYWVSRNGLVMDFNRAATSRKSGRVGHVVDMSFVGAKTPTVAFDSKAIVKTDYLLVGKKKAIHAGSYGEVRLNDVYPGIDMRNYFDQKRPRYDLVVHPGADPSKITLGFKGQTKLSVDKNGSLVMGTSLGDMKEEGLRAFTVKNGTETPVNAAFRVLPKNEVAIDLGSYDHSAKLVIDPLIYGSYFGGDDGRDEVNSVTSTPDGGVYMTGWTETIFFPVISGAYQLNLSGQRNAFVTLFRGDAYTVLYNSYIGGSVSDNANPSDDEGKFVQVSPDGTKLWVCGTTNDFDFAAQPAPPDSPVFTATSWQQSILNTQVPTVGWLIEFEINPSSTVALMPDYGTFVSPDPSATTFTLNGFVCSPVDGSLLLAGVVNGTIDSADNVNTPPGPGSNNVWLLHLSVASSTSEGITQTSLGSRYFGGSQNETVTGLASDPDGDFVISGTVPSPLGSTGFNVLDLSQNPAYFETTAVGWPNGQLLRGEDLYAAKVRSDSTMEDYWSGVVGGTQDDFAAGFNNDAGTVFTSFYDGTPILSNSVATDSLGNVYILGFSTSFDYPRTSNVIGEQNRENTCVVTEIATDASSFIYSTGLNTGGLAIPVGIAVDGAGNASITGLVKSAMLFNYTTFPNPLPPNGDADTGSVSTTTGALLGTYGWENGSSDADIPTDKGWLNVINNTATQLLYGTYIGSLGNNTINYPFVDQFGDVWVFGETDTFFGYIVDPWLSSPPSTSQPIFVSVDTPMPTGFITPLAFKANPDGPYPAPEPSPATNSPDETNWLLDYTAGIFPYLNPTPGTGFGTVSMWESTDGYVLRFRISLPVLASLTLNPNPCPGGLGATTTGTVTLSGNAPLQGANVTITINTNLAAAQFSGNSPYTTVVTIPSGQATGTFTIGTNAVNSTTPVTVEADYEGNVLFKTLTVVPWLQQFSVNPTIVAGGNNVNATVTLAAAAPQGGITCSVTADVPADISSPLPIQITVPQGSTTITVPITTAIVATQSTVNLTGTIAGVSQTVAVTLTPISIAIQSLTLAPTEIGAGGQSTGTITMASPAPESGLSINVTSSDATSAFFAPTGNNPYPSTTVVQIPPNSLSGTFTINAGTIPASTTVTITAADSQTTLTASLIVDPVGFTVSIQPASVPGGSSATGTITIAAPTTADTLTFNITSTDSNVTITPNPVVFAANGINTNVTTATFNLATSKVLSDDSETITVTLGANSQQVPLGITAASIESFAFQQSSIRSLHTDVGLVTLDQTVPLVVQIGITYGPTGTTPPSVYFSQYTTMVSVASGSNVSGPVTVTALRFTRPITVPIQAAIGANPSVGTTIGITR